MNNQRNKVLLLNLTGVFLLAVILLPAIWMFTGKQVVRPLDGAFVKSDKPNLRKFKYSRWFDGSFQSQFENSVNDHIGFHDFLVRLHNSVNYHLFESINAEGVINGKQNQLFEYDYIRAMEGEDFLGEKILDRQIRRLRFVQKELKKYNTNLFLVFEPSKTRYFSELLPERYNVAHDNPVNYSVMLELCRKYDLDFIDLNAFFLQEKNRHEYPLYPQYGTHWSIYGMFQAMDTLTDFLRSETEISVPRFEITRIDETILPRATDFDLGYLLNLLKNPKCEIMGYPRAEVKIEEGSKKPKVLAVGDSYYLNILNNKDLKELFSDHHFWYYNKHAYPDQYAKESLVADLDIKKELIEADIVLVTVTERFLYKNLWGFADDAFTAFSPVSAFEPFVQAMNQVLSTDGWFSELIDDAKSMNMTLGELLEYHADFLVYQQDKDAYRRYHGPLALEKAIRADEKWFALVKEKADKKGISVDEAVTADASYVFKNNYPEIFEEWQYKANVRQQMLNDPQWLSDITVKARERYLTLEEMIELDADYLWSIRKSEN